VPAAARRKASGERAAEPSTQPKRRRDRAGQG
jgi:hypothetical protein